MGRHLKPDQTLLECQETLQNLKSGAMQGRWMLFPDEESRDNWLEHAIGGTECCPNCGGAHDEATPEEAKRLREAAIIVPNLVGYEDLPAENGIPLVVYVLTGPLAMAAAPSIEMTISAVYAMFGGSQRPVPIDEIEVEDEEPEKQPDAIQEGEIEALDLDELTRRLTGGDSQ